MRVVIAICIISTLMLPAERFCDKLQLYSELYDSFLVDCQIIENAVAKDCCIVYFIMDKNNRYVDVLKEGAVKDTIIDGENVLVRKDGIPGEENIRKYDYAKLESSRDSIKTMLEASLPQIDRYGKSVKQKQNYYNTPVFMDAVLKFQRSVNTLIKMASVIKKRDPEFLGDYDTLETAEDIESWRAWFRIRSEIKEMQIDEALRRFEKKYGAQSDRLNLVEVFLINTVDCFRGSINGPSSLEPIFRITAVSYNISDRKFVKAVQAGVNYYFLDSGFLANLHHVGISFLVADITSEKIHEFGKASIGIQIHVGRYQFGVVNDSRDNSKKFISTVDFQIIPRLF